MKIVKNISEIRVFVTVNTNNKNWPLREDFLEIKKKKEHRAEC
jgi:hypothetical protein